MSDFFERRLYALLSDGTMLYPVFAEVRKGEDPIDVDFLKRSVSERFQVAVEELRIVSWPRWAVRLDSPPSPHRVDVGMIPAEEAR